MTKVLWLSTIAIQVLTFTFFNKMIPLSCILLLLFVLPSQKGTIVNFTPYALLCFLAPSSSSISPSINFKLLVVHQFNEAAMMKMSFLLLSVASIV